MSLCADASPLSRLTDTLRGQFALNSPPANQPCMPAVNAKTSSRKLEEILGTTPDDKETDFEVPVLQQIPSPTMTGSKRDRSTLKRADSTPDEDAFIARRSSCSAVSPSPVTSVDLKPEVLERSYSVDGTANKLPTVRCSSNPDLNCISSATVAKLLSGGFSDIKNYIVIDCRFDYEYQGGHIQGALNVNDPFLLEERFLKTLLCPSTVIVFHCEFSKHRGPMLLRFLRKLDREFNLENYPALFYPELYLLQGGYRDFFQQHKHLCDPQQYVEMKAEYFLQECKQNCATLRRTWKRQKLPLTAHKTI